MKKKILSILITMLAVCTLMLTMTARTNKVEFKINFFVDNEIYATIDTSGAEIIQMPENPTKEDYIFYGWFWDKDVWKKPFTANSLLDAPLSSDMSVYAKFAPEEMADFNFTLTSTTCSITGIIDKTITEIIVPDCVTSISQGAFSGCSSLISVVIPDSVTSIGNYAFGDCSKLTKVNYTGTIDQWVQISFSNYISNPLYYAKNLYINDVLVAEANITIATKINTYAFYNCPSLTSVVIGDSVTSIGNYAFSGCSSLTSIVIPDSVTSIGYSAFSGCSSLESITLPFVGAKAGVTSSNTYQYPFGYIFGISGYSGSYSAKQYYYGSSASSMTSTTFSIPSSLKYVTITGGNILDGAFYNCKSLTRVVIPDSVTSIGNRAFYDCDSLTSIRFNGTVAEWKAILKGYKWDRYVPATEVVCTDGTVAI